MTSRNLDISVCSTSYSDSVFAGFVESFKSGNICRFCMATTEEVQVNAVSDGTFFQRTKTEHDIHVQSVMQNYSIDSH